MKYGVQSAQLKDIRAFDPERQGRWSFSSQQATLRRLDKAFAAFFRILAADGAAGYWVMTSALLALGACHVVTAWGLRHAAPFGRMVLAGGGLSAMPIPDRGCPPLQSGRTAASRSRSRSASRDDRAGSSKPANTSRRLAV